MIYRAAASFDFPRQFNEQPHNPNSATAALNKWLRTHAPEGCVVRSFRHSMGDRLKSFECPKEIIDQIGGWPKVMLEGVMVREFPYCIYRTGSSQ